jgi:hypothetical protein
MKSLFFIFLFIYSTLSFAQYEIPEEEKQEEEEEVQVEEVSEEELEKNIASESNIMDKLWLGGTVSLGYSGNQNGSLFSLDLSPHLDYEPIKNLRVGAGVKFLYSYYQSFNFSDNRFVYGPEVSLRYALFGKALFSLDYQYLTVKYTNASGASAAFNHNVLMFGGGYQLDLGKAFAYFMFQHDFLYDYSSPTISTYPYPVFFLFRNFPVYYTFGFGINLGGLGK